MVRITDIIGEDYRDWGRPKASIVYSTTDTGDANHRQTEDSSVDNTPKTQKRKLKNAYIFSSGKERKMKKHVKYKTKGVCSRAVEFDLIDGCIYHVKFDGGCKGNTTGIGALAEGAKAEELVKKLKGIRCKGDNSCPNQLALAIEKNL